MAKKSFRRLQREKWRSGATRRQQATIDQLKLDAERVGNQSKAGGVSVRCIKIFALFADLLNDPTTVCDDADAYQVMEALRWHDLGCRPDRPEEPRLCCSCNKELGMEGDATPALAVSIRPFGKLRDAWNNPSGVAFGCGRCSKLGTKRVLDAAIDLIVQDRSTITIFDQFEL